MAYKAYENRKGIETPAVTRDVNKVFTGERFVLGYLADNGGKVYPKDLSSGLQISSARIATILKQLEARGYVRRKADKKDRRRVLVHLTPKGRKAAAANKEKAVDMLATLLEQLGPEDAEALLRIEAKMVKILEEKEREAAR